MLDNKNHQWPLVVSAERSRVTYFFTHLKRQSLFKCRDCTPLRAPCGHTGGASRVFWHAHVAPENRLNFISPLQWRNSARLIFHFTVLLLPKEKGRSHDRRTRIVYQISFCLVNSIPWNQPIFSRLPNSEPVILYNFPTCKPPFVVLLYSQKRKTGENLKAQRRRNELLTVTRFHRKIFPHPGDLP